MYLEYVKINLWNYNEAIPDYLNMEYTYNYNKTDTRESYIRLKKKKKV
jgi:hypothetical protein